MARRVLAATALAVLAAAGIAAAGFGAGGTAAAPVASACGSPAPGFVATAPTTTSTSSNYTAPAGCGGAHATTTGATSTATSPSATSKGATSTGQAITTSSAASTLVITGHGWGHGLGLSQWGAYGYARHGWSFERILLHYYPGTTIGKSPSPVVRVVLLGGASQVELASSSAWQVVDGAGTKVALPAGSVVVPASLAVSGRTLVSPLTFEPGRAPLQLAGRAYRGSLVVSSAGPGLQVVNAVGLEQYLDGVIGAEMPPSWPRAALEAQAVAARSFALSQLQTLDTPSGFDLYADGRSQAYGGVAAESPGVTRAVAATAGRVVLYHGRVATTYFSSSSGGRTVSAAEALDTPIPYLVSVPDPYDALSPFHDWGPVLLSAASVGKELGLGGPLVSLQTVAGPSGHVESATAVGPSSQVKLSGGQVSVDLGLRSSWFQIGLLTLTPPPAPVPFGSTVSLTGAARNLTGVSVEERSGSTGWQRLATVSPDVNGLFSIRVSPQTSTRYRLVAGDVRAAQISVSVAPFVTAAATGDGVRGSVRPAEAGAPLAVQRQDGDAWTTVATGATGADGTFSIRAQLAPGAYRVRCTPGRGLAPGVSPPVNVP